MTQAQALNILKTGANIFLTGEPGAGKTYVLNAYLDYLSRCGVAAAVTASTGIAATHIGGLTIHAWSGIGARDEVTERDVDAIAQREKQVKRIQKAKVLVIDEISMLSGNLFDGVERVCRTIRGNGEAFGGLQVIVVGDFFQLPPIAPFGTQPRFAFETAGWARAGFLTCYLSEQHRHEDETLAGLLGSIRSGEVEEEHYTLLGEQTDIAYEGIEPTRLFTHNKDVDSVNRSHLLKLSGRARRYTMKGSGAKAVQEGLRKNCLSPEILELREGAMVMCTKNNFEAGYVNGSLGCIVDFSSDGFPMVELSDGRTLTIHPASWQMMDEGKIRAEIMQIPLRLAWAITIHKSQGMSLDAAEIDLRNAFAFGQGYVALSRVRTLAGMKVLGLNSSALTVDPRVIKQDARFKDSSAEATRTFDGVEDDEISGMHTRFIESMGGKIPKDGDETAATTPRRMTPEKSTYEKTCELLRAGKTIGAVAKERELTRQTVWNHLEHLYETGVLEASEVYAHFPEGILWEELYPSIAEALEEHGIDKLKPIHDALGGDVSYELIRIARVEYKRD